jgi:peptide-methionine (S)-S-oxide reductase
MKILISLSLLLGSCSGQDLRDNKRIVLPKQDVIHMSISDTTETATLGAGCFWCVEAVYLSLEGVTAVKSGYCGGQTKNPSYKEVCTGNTGHAEVCQITFDPRKISYSQLLEVFFGVHDPTTLNRQGNDVGTQYRSVIFYHSDAQKKIAEQALEAADSSGNWEDKVVTEIAPFTQFYPAEEYHDNYFALNGEQPYCQMVVRPKVEKFKKVFHELLKNH